MSASSVSINCERSVLKKQMSTNEKLEEETNLRDLLVRVLRELERSLLPGREESRQIGQIVEQRFPRGQKQPRDLLLN